MIENPRFTGWLDAPMRTVCGVLVLLATPDVLLMASEPLRLTGAIVHTVSGETLSPGEVLIREGRIAAVGKSIPAANGRTIALAGLHLYPGLIALNTDLGLVEINAVRATVDVREVGDYTPDVEAWLAVNPDSELLPVARANGITHFQPVPQGGVVAGQSGLLALMGWTTEQMVTRAPIALHVYWPGMELNTAPKEDFRPKDKWTSLEEQARARSENLRALDEFFVEARAYARAREAAGNDPAKFRVNPPWEAMLPVVRGEIPVMIHADEVRQIRSAVNWAVTNGVKMILADGRDAWRVADLLAKHEVPVVYSHVFTQPNRESDGYDVHFAAPAVLGRAGVKVLFGGLEASLVKNLPYVAAQAVAFGLSPETGLRAITLHPAQVAGVDSRLGSIEVGKEATLFAAEGDLFDIRVNVKRMWIAGKEVNLENRHTRLYEKYRERPRQP